ncbi:MAG TPA: tRNA (adenosine(37)-N6)-threonylcarbamoyltransferase complex transferase subunit TsaD [Fastidiosipila sp.]|nr:tRNA (adenosine(37)-N6)-threonylcarbamoyltransferase complex transferase subunit TsaD [Fastidiosipila sp.]
MDNWKNKPFPVLGIETSCDETAAAIVDNGRYVRSEVVWSQVRRHAEFGGVVPELASRMHLESIASVVDLALKDAHLSPADLGAVAVTHGPGLVGALLVGVGFAKAFAYRQQKPLIAVHHLAGHLAANYVEHEDLEPPFLALIVSGAHSHLVLVEDYGTYRVIGRTRDDAAGEAFDKIARAMGLGYPGGKRLDELAKEGTPIIELPQTVFPDSLDFSFSGMKTAAINWLHRQKQRGEEVLLEDVAASVQKAIVDALVSHTEAALYQTGSKTLVVAGGVAANSGLRVGLKDLSERMQIEVKMPRLSWCTDNAVMIASAGYFAGLSGEYASLDLNARPVLAM